MGGPIRQGSEIASPTRGAFNRTSLSVLEIHMVSYIKDNAIYHRLKASSLYDLYWRVADPRIIGTRTNEVRFYRELLDGFRPGDLIFDVGANQGSKTDIFLRLGARVVAVDPDEANQQVLKHKFRQFRLTGSRVTIIPMALSDRRAVETMWIDQPGSAKNTLSKKWVDTLRTDEARFGQKLSFQSKRDVETTTLEDLMVSQGRPFFVKIDVEGMEPSVLRGLKNPVPYLSFEVNLPEFRAEGLECLEILHRVTPDGRFNYAPDCQGGLASHEWLTVDEISEVLRRCNEPSIEVFWRTAYKRA
jgi:FkbM family methyltransferase